MLPAAVGARFRPFQTYGPYPAGTTRTVIGAATPEEQFATLQEPLARFAARFDRPYRARDLDEECKRSRPRRAPDRPRGGEAGNEVGLASCRRTEREGLELARPLVQQGGATLGASRER